MNKDAVKFVTDVFSEQEANVVAFGVECPASLREVSRLVEPFDIDEQRNLLDNVKLYDAGDVEFNAVNQYVKELIERKKTPLIIGGEHVVTLHSVKAMPKGVKLIVFDAHADVKDEYEGSKLSHACWLRRLCESFDCKDIAIVGVRSCDEDEFEFMKSSGITHFTAKEIRESAENVKQRLQSFVGDSDVYVSVDMDVFDPSVAPAVKYPEPGGILYRDFLALVETMKGGKLVGLDCVEIRPLGENKITEFLAIKIIFKLLSMERV